MTKQPLSPVLYLPHGGGPMPLLNDPSHAKLTTFLTNIRSRLGNPAAILVVSAHWEEPVATLSTHPQPPLYFDYSNFPLETYRYSYPAPGYPELATDIQHLLQQQGIATQTDQERGYDHGLFVPLMLMYPQADIPCLQVSLLSHLDPEQHIALGEALASLRERNVLIIGSGMSYHNMAGFGPAKPQANAQATEFDHWLVETCTSSALDYPQQRQRLINWRQAPQARNCHPREEHLLPLHVCLGAGGRNGGAELVFNDDVLGRRVSGFLWA